MTLERKEILVSLEFQVPQVQWVMPALRALEDRKEPKVITDSRVNQVSGVVRAQLVPEVRQDRQALE